MKIQLKSTLAFFGVLSILLIGCKKKDGVGTNIRTVYTSAVQTKYGSVHTGTFTAVGGVSGAGTAVMSVHVTEDSTFCNVWLTSDLWSLKIKEECSRAMDNPTGGWYITNGTGIYSSIHGKGKLTMTFPPNVPKGVTVIEEYTGVVWVTP